MFAMTRSVFVVAALAAALVAAPTSLAQATGEEDEFSPANSRTYPLDLTGRGRDVTCVQIPSDLSLCTDIGYDQMRMPNLLDHDSLEEVKHQAQSWVPLLLQECHEGTQLFLCTLFAPVCLDRPIYPCRSLCEEVQAGCGPVMEDNCFPWPEMLDCSKFPPDNDLCIKSDMRDQNATTASQAFTISSAMQEQYMSLFTQCYEDSPPATLIRKFCTSDFVLKIKIKSTRESKDGKKYIGDNSPDKITVLKQGSLKKKDLKKLVFYVREGANCRCDMLDHSGNYLLIMGHRGNDKRNRKLFMTFVHSWGKTRDFRRVVKSFEDPAVCLNRPDPFTVGGGLSDGRQQDEGSPRPRVESESPMPDLQETSPAQVPAVEEEEQEQLEVELSPADQTNTPVNDGVPASTTHQIMSDGTPSPANPKPSSRRDRKRKRNRDRESRRKERNREHRTIPVKG